MSHTKEIPVMNSYEEMAEFWDAHSLSDYWEQTEPAEFEFSPQSRGRYLITVNMDIVKRLQRLAQVRGLSLESLTDLVLKQSLSEFEAQLA